MPITLLDLILLVVMLISALLAMVRGFMREVLSIASWAAAAVLTLYTYPKLKPVVLQYFSNEIIASAICIGGVFLGTLLIVSVLTIKISDTILDSRVGALDRTLGFLFGLGRGLVMPLDQMHIENPASHPELLQWLAHDFAANQYDLRRFVRGLCVAKHFTPGFVPSREIHLARFIRHDVRAHEGDVVQAETRGRDVLLQLRQRSARLIPHR